MVQQALDAANKANTSVAVLDSSIRQTLRDQEKNVVGAGSRGGRQGRPDEHRVPGAAGVGIRHRRALSKMQAQMVDMQNAVQTIQAPAAAAAGRRQPGSGSRRKLPPAPAETLYANAQRDRLGGKLELALQEFRST